MPMTLSDSDKDRILQYRRIANCCFSPLTNGPIFLKPEETTVDKTVSDIIEKGRKELEKILEGSTTVKRTKAEADKLRLRNNAILFDVRQVFLSLKMFYDTDYATATPEGQRIVNLVKSEDQTELLSFLMKQPNDLLIMLKSEDTPEGSFFWRMFHASLSRPSPFTYKFLKKFFNSEFIKYTQEELLRLGFCGEALNKEDLRKCFKEKSKLAEAFNWHNSKEGFMYWSDIFSEKEDEFPTPRELWIPRLEGMIRKIPDDYLKEKETQIEEQGLMPPQTKHQPPF